MRIVVHDYAGHPFQVELSRELARRGHQVLHLYCASVVGPRGNLAASPGDPAGLAIEGVSIGPVFDKYSLRRVSAEIRYGTKLARRVHEFDPRVVLSANTPLLSQRLLLRESRRARRRFLYWWQDSYGEGARQVLASRSAVLGRVVGGAATRLERSMLEDSDRVIAIAPAMASLATTWGVDPSIVVIIPNWAPIGVAGAELGRAPEVLAGGGRPTVLYAGTLGLKHDPALLRELARRLGDEATVLVLTEGPGRVALEQANASEPLPNLELDDYRSVKELHRALHQASVLIVLLRRAAGAFSVPSKVLTYLAAGRPIVGSLPAQNAAAEVLLLSGAGTVVEPDDVDGFVDAVQRYLRDPAAAAAAGNSGRRWAQDHFAIGPIADRFTALMTIPRRSGRAERRPTSVARDTVRRVWTHPSNRGHRAQRLVRYFAWQVWQRVVRRPIEVELAPNRRVRCHPHSPVTSAIIYFGLPDHAEMRFVRDYMRAGETFVDVGAHEGVYSLLATATTGVNAIAIEPSSSAFERLERNVDLNAARSQIRTIRCAFGPRAGRVMLTVGRDAMNAVVAAESGSCTESVEASTLDALARDGSVGPIAMVKIDVEGAELDVLAGGSALLAAHRPVLLVEVNDPDGLARFAEAADYTPVRYDAELRILTPVTTAEFDGRNILLVPDLAAVAARLAT